ncbi:MAG: membrane protein insertion efficiency factor YidD [Oscillospiraceae bacterium]|nr:membrane protein insertion efficiency factor YidD [Oscillospiraceae bacterium]
MLGSWRLLRCNPLAKGGVDYVPDRFVLSFRNNEKK